MDPSANKSQQVDGNERHLMCCELEVSQAISSAQQSESLMLICF